MSLKLSVTGPGGKEETVVRTGPLVTIGRGEDNDLVLRDNRISARHVRLVRRGEGYWLEELGSRNGSLLERNAARTLVRLGEPVAVQSGDLLLLGDLVSPVVIRVLEAPRAGSSPEEGATVVARRAIADGDEALGELDLATLRALFRLLGDLGSRSEPTEVLARVAQAAFERYPTLTTFTLLLRQPDGDYASEFVRQAAGHEGPAIPLGPQQLREAARLGEVLLFVPVAGPARPVAPGVALVPLTAGRELIGLLQLEARAGTFTSSDTAWLGVVGVHTAASLVRARRLEHLRRSETRLLQENTNLRALAALPRPIIGQSPALLASLEQLRRVAATSTSVLLLGETGTGKELAARLVHAASPRANRNFLAINVAALPPQLLESELFGHRKGSFTGAVRDHKGVFEAADHGTVFLDEVGEIPLELQVKLLRVLQEQEIRPVGATQGLRVDVRLVAATNRDLKAELQAGRFRQDLYYRLAVFPIELPPLRSRVEDIELLAEHFREAFCAHHGIWVPGFTTEAIAWLKAQPWPGNIRELEHAIERAVILARDGQLIDLALLDPRGCGAQPPPEPLPSDGSLPRGPLREVLEQLEEQLIRRCLKEHHENRTLAAQVLGISRQALQVKLAKWREREA